MKSCLSGPKALLSLFLYSILVVHFQSHKTNEIVQHRRSSSVYCQTESQEDDEPNSSNADSAAKVLQHGPNIDATSRPNPPFFIGAGLGTTGTTALYNAMCMMGFPSVHFRRSCIHPVALLNSNRNSSSTLQNQNDFETQNVLKFSRRDQDDEKSNHRFQQMDAEKAKGVLAHRRLLRSWRSLRVCTRRSRQPQNQHGVSATCENFTGIVDDLFHQASQVVKSGLVLVTDTPYPFLMDIIVQVAKKQRPFTGIILTERDPQAWVSSRLRHHVGESDLMCFHPKNAFDLPKCLEQNNRHQHPPSSEQKNDTFGMMPSPPDRQYKLQKLTFQHSEILGGNYSKQEKQYYRSLLVHSMNKHHTKIKSMMDGRIILINLWNENLPTVPDLARALWERMEAIVPQDILEQYKNAAIPLQSIRR